MTIHPDLRSKGAAGTVARALLERGFVIEWIRVDTSKEDVLPWEGQGYQMACDIEGQERPFVQVMFGSWDKLSKCAKEGFWLHAGSHETHGMIEVCAKSSASGDELRLPLPRYSMLTMNA